MLALPPPVAITKEDNPAQLMTASLSEGPLNPPIITHTAATPMATPQGSPNESALKDINNKLAVSMGRTIQRSTLSVESERTSVSLHDYCHHAPYSFGTGCNLDLKVDYVHEKCMHIFLSIFVCVCV